MENKCKYTKRDQLNFTKDLSILQFDLNWSLAYRYGIKDESTLNIHVKCEGGISKYDNMMVIEEEGGYMPKYDS